MSVDSVIDRVGGDDLYVRFLIAERPYIRSALDARGICLDEEWRSTAYASSIGNSLHCDLVEVERWLATLSPVERALIEEWAEKQSVRPVFGQSRLRRVAKILRSYKR